jgi:hypothetical protein
LLSGRRSHCNERIHCTEHRYIFFPRDMAIRFALRAGAPKFVYTVADYTSEIAHLESIVNGAVSGMSVDGTSTQWDIDAARKRLAELRALDADSIAAGRVRPRVNLNHFCKARTVQGNPILPYTGYTTSVFPQAA